MKPEVVLVDQPLLSGLPRKYFPTAKLVYRPTDTYSKGAAASRQEHLLKRASGIIATSLPVYAALDADPSLPYKVVENGVELSRFSLVESYERQGFVYIGALDYRFDWALVKTLAEKFPSERIDLYGRVSVPHPNLPSNATLHGPISYNYIPSILNQYRVGLIPLGPADVNAGRSPMKYFEYLAAGLYVVATSTPALSGRGVPGVFLYSDPNSAIAAASEAISFPHHNVPGIKAAALEDWSEKSKQILAFVQRL
ncbi:glycosyltransferase family protein [Arthrobacter sp. TMS1-12-1]